MKKATHDLNVGIAPTPLHHQKKRLLDFFIKIDLSPIVMARSSGSTARHELAVNKKSSSFQNCF